MELETKYFSKINYEQEDILTFSEGLFGFQEYKSFLVLPFDQENNTLVCLQSTQEVSIAFVLMNPYHFLPNYIVDLSKKDIAQLDISKDQDVLIYTICVMKDDMAASTTNLKCPLVINMKTCQAKQLILEDSTYTFQHSFAELLKKEG